MQPIVTLSGVDEALSNLGYANERYIKTRFIRALRQFYSDEDSVRTVTDINTDDLIRLIWDKDAGGEAVKNKRKNFSSIKSSINADLTRLHDEGKNPEGIIIGRNNTFDMSDKAKNELLENFSSGGSSNSLIPMKKINDVLQVINDILRGMKSETGSSDDKNNLDQLKELIQNISQRIGISGEQSLNSVQIEKLPSKEVKEDLEELETDEGLIDAVIEDAGDELQEVEEVEDAGDVEDTEDVDEIEVIEDIDDVEDVEEIDEVDDLEEADEIPEDQEIPDDVEEIEADEALDDAAIEDAGDELQEVEEVEDAGDVEDTEDDLINNERILADEFNHMLSERDRYYNQYILIPEGSYLIGGKDTKRNCHPAEKVDIKAFYFGKFPVTNAHFEVFIEKTGYVTTAEKIGHSTVYYGRYHNTTDNKTGLKTINWNSAIESKVIEGACWYQPTGPGSTLYNRRNHPVVQVSLEDAMAFAKWTGKRLPTEVQWEAASRTFKSYDYPWGKEYKTGYCNVEDSYIGDTTPVDKYPKSENSLGIMDTLGNIMEWTIDTHQPSEENGHGPFYVLKGGSWISGKGLSLYIRSFAEPDSASNIIGFRCIAY